MDDLEPTKPVVAVTGATGFIGRAFIRRCRDRFEIIGLSRSHRRTTPQGPAQWRKCDLYGIRQIKRALQGCDVALYLVHSMSPSARLTQARFEDLDLILADNFARGAAAAGVKHIIYIGGLIPENETLSKHLASRLEVEEALAAHGATVTTLRAGLVVGRGGSSFRMLHRLVARLPLMLLPAWTQTETQPIAVEDIVDLVGHCIDDPALAGHSWDVGGPDRRTYAQMIADVADLMGKRRLLLRVPFFSPGFSRLWVALITGTSRALVNPLVESLRHRMVPRQRALQSQTGVDGTPWREAAKRALTERTKVSALDRPLPRRVFTSRRTVRSVQRLPRPDGASASAIAEEYLRWLPRFLHPLLRNVRDDNTVSIFVRFMRRPLLVLRFVPKGRDDRALFRVEGGLLATATEQPGRLEFRVTPDGRSILAAIHDFVPRLPWYIYVLTQAVAHLFVMYSFGRHLERAGSLRELRGSPGALTGAAPPEPD